MTSIEDIKSNYCDLLILHLVKREKIANRNEEENKKFKPLIPGMTKFLSLTNNVENFFKNRKLFYPK